MENKNITWHQAKVTRHDRFELNNHKSCVLWFTGFSASGKSTLANEVELALYERKIRSYVLDGDNVRHGLNKNLGFSPEDRSENIRRIGEVSKLFVDAGLFALSAFISPYCIDRDMVRAMFQKGEFIEIYVKCSLTECERRDPKGLYKKALAGEIKQFTGVSAPYEAPLHPEIIIDTEKSTIQDSVGTILNYLQQNGYIEVH